MPPNRTPVPTPIWLQDPDGIEQSFAVCRFHHDASIRKSQWENMTALSHLIPADTIFLSDHNSVILPTRDVSLPRFSPEQRDVLEAREQEISFPIRHGLIDAFATLHAYRTDNFPLAGWTWGFPPAQPSGTPTPNTEQHEFDLSDTSIDRQRRIDRVMIPSAFMSSLCECFPCFLASSDHKAVVLSLRAIAVVLEDNLLMCTASPAGWHSHRGMGGAPSAVNRP